MRRGRVLTGFSTAIGLALVVSGCASGVGEHPSPSSSQTASGTVSPSETPTQSPSSEPTATPDGRTLVAVTIPRAEWDAAAGVITAAAFLPVIADTDGVCVLTAIAGATVITGEPVPALLDAQSVVCGGLSVGGPALGAGRWDVTVTFTSTNHIGTSAPVEVVVR